MQKQLHYQFAFCARIWSVSVFVFACLLFFMSVLNCAIFVAYRKMKLKNVVHVSRLICFTTKQLSLCHRLDN